MDSDQNLTVISLGAGVQSTVMALLAAEGEITPMPDLAIFADTGWEPQRVYDHLEWLEEKLPFETIRVSIGSNLRDDLMRGVTARGGHEFFSVPVFILDDRGKRTITRRQCTSEYKIVPITREIRKQLGYPPSGGSMKRGTWVQQWMGISTDEIWRAKTPRNSRHPAYIRLRYPLIDMDWSRHDCLEWFGKRYPGRRLVKSACIGCPYTTKKDWLEMHDERPADLQDAIEVEQAMQQSKTAEKFGGRVFLHQKAVPLSGINWEQIRAEGQQSEMFDDCEGYCHV